MSRLISDENLMSPSILCEHLMSPPISQNSFYALKICLQILRTKDWRGITVAQVPLVVSAPVISILYVCSNLYLAPPASLATAGQQLRHQMFPQQASVLVWQSLNLCLIQVLFSNQTFQIKIKIKLPNQNQAFAVAQFYFQKFTIES